jgi:hypothetical protein
VEVELRDQQLDSYNHEVALDACHLSRTRKWGDMLAAYLCLAPHHLLLCEKVGSLENSFCIFNGVTYVVTTVFNFWKRSLSGCATVSAFLTVLQRFSKNPTFSYVLLSSWWCAATLRWWCEAANPKLLQDQKRVSDKLGEPFSQSESG